jgi:hypothetical protein
MPVRPHDPFPSRLHRFETMEPAVARTGIEKNARWSSPNIVAMGHSPVVRVTAG